MNVSLTTDGFSDDFSTFCGVYFLEAEVVLNSNSLGNFLMAAFRTGGA